MPVSQADLPAAGIGRTDVLVFEFPGFEAVLMLHHHRLTMREVPVRMYHRGGGVSSITGSGKSFYYMVKVLLALFVGLGRRRAVPEPGEAAAVAADHGI